VSESSESVHLRSTNPNEAVELLKRAKVAGFVFPERNGWVSFVHSVNDPEDRFRVEQANTGLLLFYDYAEDHGVWVNIHEGKKRVARLKASFGQPNAVFDRAAFERLGLLSAAGAAAVDGWVKRAHIWHERSRAKYFVAERLGLSRYQWFSYRSERERMDATRIEVLPDGSVRRPPKPTAPHVAVAPPKKAKTRTKTKAKAKAAAKKKTSAKKTSAKKKVTSKSAPRRTRR
jgi:hypothetical protein